MDFSIALNNNKTCQVKFPLRMQEWLNNNRTFINVILLLD